MNLREFAKIAVGSLKDGNKETLPKTIEDSKGATEKHIRQIAKRKIDVGENRGKPLVKKGGAISKALKAAALVGGGAGVGAGLTHALAKRREKKVAKKFYWLGRNTDPGTRR